MWLSPDDTLKLGDGFLTMTLSWQQVHISLHSCFLQSLSWFCQSNIIHVTNSILHGVSLFHSSSVHRCVHGGKSSGIRTGIRTSLQDRWVNPSEISPCDRVRGASFLFDPTEYLYLDIVVIRSVSEYFNLLTVRQSAALILFFFLRHAMNCMTTTGGGEASFFLLLWMKCERSFPSTRRDRQGTQGRSDTHSWILTSFLFVRLADGKERQWRESV